VDYDPATGCYFLADGIDSELRTAVAVLAYTGMRVSEACGLRWGARRFQEAPLSPVLFVIAHSVGEKSLAAQPLGNE
jgi:hypothetical protein